MSNLSIGNRLQRGERVLWSGKPGGGLIFTAGDIFLIPFSVVWLSGVAAIFFDTTFDKRDAREAAFSLIPVLFVLIGFFMTFGRFILDIWLRQRTSYTVTSERIVIERSAPFSQSISLPLVTLPQIEMRGDAVSRGTLRFGTSDIWARRGLAGAVPSLDPMPQFLAINDAGNVYQLIMDAARDLRSGGR